MADNKRRGRFGKGTDEDSSQSIFDLFDPPPADTGGRSFGKVPVVRNGDDDDELDLTDVEFEAKAAADVEAAGLKHWTEPATGQVPAAFSAEQNDRWAEVTGPSWRGEDPNWAGPDLSDVFADTAAISHERVIDDTDVARADEIAVDPDPTRPPRVQAPAAPAPTPRPSVFDRPPSTGPLEESPRRRAAAPVRPIPTPVTPLPEASPHVTAPVPSTAPAAAGPTTKRRGAHDLPPAEVAGPPPGPSEAPQPAERLQSAESAAARAAVPPPDRAHAREARPDGRRVAVSPDHNGHPDESYDEPDEGGRSLGQSIAVGVALAAVVFLALWLGPVPALLLVGVLTLLAVMELFNAMRIAGLRPATLLGLVGAVALPAATYLRGDAGYPLVIGLAVVFGMLWYLTGADTERPVLNLGLTLTGILWIGGLAGFAALMIRGEDGTGLLMATIMMAVASDTLAYLGGRAYGTKAFHAASPNKTWEGTVTGFFGALFVGLVLGVTDLIDVFDGQFVSVMVLAAVVGVLTPTGDLAESMVKRDLGIKDMGTLLPGHGGVLDRVDGLLFALPGAYYVAVMYSLI